MTDETVFIHATSGSGYYKTIHVKGDDMTAKQYLCRIAFYIDAVRTLEAKITGSGAIDYSKDRVQVSPKDVMAEQMAQLLEMRNRLHKELMARMSMIERMDNPVYARILWMRYVQNKQWHAIASDSGYAVDTVIKYHALALKQFAHENKDVLNGIKTVS